jgi:hypothetical protein
MRYRQDQADFAECLECARLAAAFEQATASQSGSKLSHSIRSAQYVITFDHQAVPLFRVVVPQRCSRFPGHPKIPVARDFVAVHLFSMSTVDEIKTEISRLSLEERAELTADLCGWTDDDWDRQMKADAVAGKLTALNRDAQAAHTAGRSVSLEDILREP